MNGVRERRFVKLDDDGTGMTLLPSGGAAAAPNDVDHITLQRSADEWKAVGKLGGHDVQMLLKRIDESGMPLVRPTESFDL